MALGVIEKSKLQRESRQLQVDIKGGELGVMDKLAKQKAWRAIMLQLKADVQPITADPLPATPTSDDGEGEGTDEEAEQEVSRSVQGFTFAGADHPAWALQYQKDLRPESEVVLSNQSLSIAILWEPFLGTKRDAFFIGWPSYTEKMAIPADRAWDGIKSPFSAKLRKKVRRLVEQAQRTVTSALTDGVAGFTIAVQTNGIGKGQVQLTKDGKTGTGDKTQEAYDDWKVAAGGLQAALEGANNGNLKSAIAALTNYTDAKSILATGDNPQDVLDLAKQLAIIGQTGVDNQTPLADMLVEKANQVVSAAEQAIDIAAKAASEPANNDDTLAARYLRGEFNQDEPKQFRDRIVDVYKAGLTLDQVKTGVVSWIEANPELIAA